MKRIQRNQAELLATIDHLNYEFEMFQSIANGLFSGIFNDGVIKNALVESFTIHTRTILEFFYSKDPRIDDVIAEDFFIDEDLWKKIRPSKTDGLNKVHLRIGKEVAHLSYKRNQVTDEEKQWSILDIYLDLEKVIRIFNSCEERSISMTQSASNSYYVYENWVAEGHKARIHLAKCSYCNDGRGIHKNETSVNGTWHGPFNTIRDAQTAAVNTGGHVSKCKHCNPT